MFHFICVIAPILATVMVLRFRMREAFLATMGKCLQTTSYDTRTMLRCGMKVAADRRPN